MPKRWTDTDLTASHMAQLGRFSPPSSVTAMWCGKRRSLLVSGTTMQ